MNFDLSGRLEEYELKLQVSAGQLARIRKNPALQTMLSGPPVTRKLRSIYFDTPDHLLRANDVSLRVRRIGKKWIQTVKSGAAVAAGVWRRAECETRVKQPEPVVSGIKRDDLRGLIERIVRDAPLVPVFETVFQRTTHQLVTPGGSGVELALDRGEVRAPLRRADICEAEFELKHGEPSAVFELAELLFTGEAIRFSNASKSEFGYQTAAAEPVALPKPRSAARIQVAQADTVHSAFHGLLLQCSDLIAQNLRVIAQTDHPEGPHQLRVALRKLRCGIKAYGLVVENRSLTHIKSDARKLARLVGELRDADVLIAEIADPVMADMPDEPGMRSLGKLLRRHRERVRRRVRSELEASWIGMFQLRLLAFAEAKTAGENPPKKPTRKPGISLTQHASASVEACWNEVVAKSKHLRTLGVEERHEVRKALRNLRYVTHFHAPVFPAKPLDRFIVRLKALQNVFGYLNDVALAEKLPEIRAGDTGGNAAVQGAVRCTIQWHEAQAEQAWLDAKSRLRALKRGRPFWRTADEPLTGA